MSSWTFVALSQMNNTRNPQDFASYDAMQRDACFQIQDLKCLKLVLIPACFYFTSFTTAHVQI